MNDDIHTRDTIPEFYPAHRVGRLVTLCAIGVGVIGILVMMIVGWKP